MAFTLGLRSESDRLSRLFGRALRVPKSVDGDRPGSLLGLEHEFRVLVEGRPVDFGRLIHHLDIPGYRVDPADPNAYRGAWGGSITADDREAEIAIAPVRTGPRCTGELLLRARTGRSLLANALPAGATLEGFSTHLSVAVSDRLVERAAAIYVRTFAPALMLLLDGPESPGLLVRPRPGRLELGGDFVDGNRLGAAAAFALGSVRLAALAARRRPFADRHLPPSINVAAEPALERYGWFVGRQSMGVDLYAAGRRARLPLRSGGTVDAGAHLARCWAAARRVIAAELDPSDLEVADALVAGRVALGIEGTQSAAIAIADSTTTDGTAAGDVPTRDPFGSAVVVRARPGFTVSPAMLSWDFAVLRLAAGDRVAFACLPRRAIGPALDALDAGNLDALVERYLVADRPGTERSLMARKQTARAGLYGVVGRAANLVASEHSPLGGAGDRPGKRSRDNQQPTDHGSSSTSAGAGAGAVGAGIGGVAASATSGVAGATTILGFPIAVAAGIGSIVVVAVIGGLLLLGGSPTASTGPSVAPTPPPSLAALATTVPASPSSSTLVSTPAGQTLAPEPTPDPSCLREPDLRSTSGADGHTIQFINHLQIPLQTIWIGYDGKRVKYADVPPGTAYFQPTFLTHPWIFADPAGNCLRLDVTDPNLTVVQLGP